jgi:predicted anti-sigma-YlaC factor YlaD
MTCDYVSISLGAYALGTLDLVDRAVVEEHLDGCESCRAALEEIAGLPQLLSLLTVSDIAVLGDHDPTRFEVGDELYQRLAAVASEDIVHEKEATARHRGRRWLAAAAAAVIVAGTGTTVGLWATQQHHSQWRTVSATSTAGVRMNVGLDAQASGTALRVSVTGLRKDEQCWLYAVDRNGHRDLAGSWTSTYKGNAQQTGSTDIPSSELSQLVLVGSNHQTLVSVPV